MFTQLFCTVVFRTQTVEPECYIPLICATAICDDVPLFCVAAGDGNTAERSPHQSGDYQSSNRTEYTAQTDDCTEG